MVGSQSEIEKKISEKQRDSIGELEKVRRECVDEAPVVRRETRGSGK